MRIPILVEDGVVDEDGVEAVVVAEEDAVVVVVGMVTRNNDEIGNQTELERKSRVERHTSYRYLRLHTVHILARILQSNTKR